MAAKVLMTFATSPPVAGHDSHRAPSLSAPYTLRIGDVIVHCSDAQALDAAVPIVRKHVQATTSLPAPFDLFENLKSREDVGRIKALLRARGAGRAVAGCGRGRRVEGPGLTGAGHGLPRPVAAARKPLPA